MDILTVSTSVKCKIVSQNREHLNIYLDYQQDKEILV